MSFRGLYGMSPQASDLIEFASDAGFAIDANSRIVAWNKLAERLLGYTSSEAIGQYCRDILQAALPGGEPLCYPGCDISQCFKKCQPYGVPSCRVQHKNGAWIEASIATIAVPEHARRLDSTHVLAVIFIRDSSTLNARPDQQTLQIFSLGSFGLVVAGRSVAIDKWKRKQALTLLKYLLTQLDRPVHRERLIDSLWPGIDQQQGWGRLKVAMYCLRSELRANGIKEDVIKTSDKAYILRRDAVWVDTFAFERLITEGGELQRQGQWNDALCHYNDARLLYRGDYLEEEVFSDWCAEERERFREIYLELLGRTAECHAELGQYAEAVHICRKALVFDPCRESFHCLLMENLVNSGYPGVALAQFRHCQQILDQEFGSEPLAKTRRLYQEILNGEIATGSVNEALTDTAS
ncbi:MAG: PAS domain S-box protein [Gammaproteobacteria bacterium]|nr:PAS domain S-box protein [Gammaproteobacteria bacterium]